MSDELQEQKDRELTNRYGETIGHLVESATGAIISALYSIRGESPKYLCREALKLLDLVSRSANARHPVGDVDSVREAVARVEGEVRGFLRRPLVAKDGLLWSDGFPLSAHRADRLADLYGFGCGEQLVHKIEREQREREEACWATSAFPHLAEEVKQAEAERHWLKTHGAAVLGGKIHTLHGTFDSVADAMKGAK